MRALSAAGLLLLQGALAADLRVGLYSLDAPRSVTVNGETVRAPIQRLWAGPVRLAVAGSAPLRLDGPLEIRSLPDGRLRLVHTLALESYVAGVLAGEASPGDPPEYLKALAIAIRTYAITSLGNHRADGFHLCDTTHCQDLRLAAVAPLHHEIAEATAGVLLWRDGRPAPAPYHAHCGGQREGIGPDTFCTARGNDTWQARVDGLRLLERTATGRVKTVTLAGRVMTGDAFMTAWNRQHGYTIKSLLFDVHGDGRITGRGRGHGRGLCQTGARRMAELGRGYREILTYYYPGTVTGLTAAGLDWQHRRSARVDLLSARPDQDAPLLAAAEAALGSAEERTGWRTAQRIRLRAYPNVAVFRDATGASGATAALAKGRVIHLAPGGGAALRHEMLHVLLEEHAAPAGHPWWFREGLALVLAGDPPSRDARYESARRRVAALIARNGRAGVLGFWQRGLPAEIAGKP